MVTIILPISREEHLKKVFDCIELMDTPEDTSILTIVDGTRALYVKARNLTETTKFNDRLCIYYSDDDKVKQFNIAHRRKRIAKIHNFAKDYVNDSTYVFLIEDDTTFKSDTLTKLLDNYAKLPFAGSIQGYQIGRWGIDHYGVWSFDDIYNPTEVKTQLKQKGLTECDAGGLYCLLTKTKYYKWHDFDTFDNGGFGPDVDFGVQLRRQGMKNYTDWSIPCDHHVGDKIIKPNQPAKQVTYQKKGVRWRQVKAE